MMRRIKKLRIKIKRIGQACLFVCLAIMPACHCAQDFQYQSELTGVNKTGLHKIALTPEHREKMAADFHDVRIVDSSGSEIPYVVLSEQLNRTETDFVPYKIISQKHFDTYSEIIIDNSGRQAINNIAFSINHSDALKRCIVEGSDDRTQWYSVSEGQQIGLAYNSNYTSSYNCIYFLNNNYRYFRLLIDDWNAQPFKINKAGYFKNTSVAGRLNRVNCIYTITQDKENKSTQVKVTFPAAMSLTRMDIKVSSPRLYSRHARILAKRSKTVKKQTTQYLEALFDFQLESGNQPVYDLPQFSERELIIEINNEDNPSLGIDSVIFWQQAAYLVCDLNAGERYTLKCGNKTLPLPSYDLGTFVSSVAQIMPEASLGGLKLVPLPSKKEPFRKEKPFYETKNFFWLCLGIGALIAIYFSTTLFKDISGREKK